MSNFKSIDCTDVDKFWKNLDPLNPFFERNPYFDHKPFKPIYRGHGDANWNLLPSILRDVPSRTAERQAVYEKVILEIFMKECDLTGLYFPKDSIEFRNKHLVGYAKNIIDDKYIIDPTKWPDRDLIELMALAQHHRVPTRLLDWTQRSYAAAYFAASTALSNYDKWKEDTKIAVWALDIEQIHKYQNIEIVRVPGSTSKNLAAQSGLFTLWKQGTPRGEPFRATPLEDEFISTQNNIIPLYKMTLPVKYAPKILDYCRLHGVSASTLFPGYDGAAKAVIDDINAQKAWPKIDPHYLNI